MFPRRSNFLKISLSFSRSKLSLPLSHSQLLQTTFNIHNHSQHSQIHHQIYRNFSIFSAFTRSHTNAFEEASKLLQSPNQAGIEEYKRVFESLTSSKDPNKLTEKEATIILQVLFKLGKAYHHQMDHTEALKYYLEALSIADKTKLHDSVDIALINNGIGTAYLSQDELEKAEESFNKAKKIFAGPAAMDDELKYPSIENLCMQAVLFTKQNNLQKALDYSEKVLIRIDDINDKSIADSLKLVTYDNLGYIFFKKKDLDRAVDYWQKALDIVDKNHGEDSLEAKVLYERIAWSFYDKTEYEKALVYAEKCLYVARKKFGDDHIQLGSSLSLLGQIYFKMGDYDEAIQNYERLSSILQVSPDEYEKQPGETYMLMAKTYMHKKDYSKAEESFQKALQVIKATSGEQSVGLAECYIIWATLLRAKKETLVKAKKYYDEALKIYTNLGNVSQSRFIHVHTYLGEIAYYEGKYEESLDHFEECLRRSDDSVKSKKLLEEIYSFMGAIKLKQSKMEEGVIWYEKAVDVCKELENKSKHLDYHYQNLGTAYKKKGDDKKAKESYEKALDFAEREHGKKDERTLKNAKQLLQMMTKLNLKDEAEKLKTRYEL